MRINFWSAPNDSPPFFQFYPSTEMDLASVDGSVSSFFSPHSSFSHAVSLPYRVSVILHSLMLCLFLTWYRLFSIVSIIIPWSTSDFNITFWFPAQTPDAKFTSQEYTKARVPWEYDSGVVRFFITLHLIRWNIVIRSTFIRITIRHFSVCSQRIPFSSKTAGVLLHLIVWHLNWIICV